MHAVYNIAMDCITFNKDIIAYLDGELSDEELNDFLHHLEGCRSCAEELEINYIVREGVKLLDRKNSSYDLSSAFRQNTKENTNYIKNKKILIRAAYAVGTVAFWALLASVFIFFRIMYVGV